MPLCRYCVRLAPDWLIADIYDKRGQEKPRSAPPEHRFTYPSWLHLIESAKSCELCALFVQESRQAPDNDPFWKTERKGIRIQAMGLTRLEVVCEEAHKVANLSFGFNADEAEAAPADAQQLLGSRLPGKSAGDPQTISAVHRWLSGCRAKHARCSQWSSLSPGERQLPTRVLDVSNGRVRLHHPSDTVQEDYVSLSYCWGHGNPYTTVEANLAKHMEGIELGMLPPTLQDVVRLTRLLKFKYLWIDALCIVQDDREDWLREASKMRAVYSRAALTISTDMLPDTTVQFLDRERTARHDIRIALPWTREPAPIAEQRGILYNGSATTSPNPDEIRRLSMGTVKDSTTEPKAIYVVPTFRTFKVEIENSPIAKRGWTFQERALSPRILHIGMEMCYWECKEACDGEDSALGHVSSSDRFFNLRDMMLTTGVDAHGKEMTPIKLHAKWAWVVEEFSRRALTNQADLFPALEGVAALFAEKKMLGQYCFGIWEDEFLRGLLWVSDRRTAPVPPLKRLREYRAPSWSWASVCGPVHNPALETAFVKTADGGLQLLDELGNDGVLGGTGRLSHKLLVLQGIQGETEGDRALGPVKSACFTAQAMLTPVKRIHVGTSPRGVFALVSLTIDALGVAWWDEDDEQGGLDPDFWICPVYQARQMVEGWAVSDCLVLKKSARIEGAYERVAKARVRNTWVQGTVKTFISVV